MRQERVPKTNKPSKEQFLLDLEQEKPKPVITRGDIVLSILRKGGLNLTPEEQAVADEDEIEDRRQAKADHPYN